MSQNDRIEGEAKETGGQIKEGVGKVTGDQEMKAEGEADQAEGGLQKGIGKIKDMFTGKS